MVFSFDIECPLDGRRRFEAKGAWNKAASWSAPARLDQRTDVRAAMNGVMYIQSTGCGW